MQKTVHFCVKVHTCSLLQERILESQMVPGERYVCVKNPEVKDSFLESWLEESEYCQMKPHCPCRRWITFHDAVKATEEGDALWAFRIKKHAVGRCEPGFPRDNSMGHIWQPKETRGKVPRIDLITKADVQRAYGLKNETPSERQKLFAEYIEQVNLLTLEERAKMIVPFEPDAFVERPLIFTPGYDSGNNFRLSQGGNALYDSGVSMFDLFHGIRK